MKILALLGLLLHSGCLYIVAGTAAAKSSEPKGVHRMFVPLGQAYPARGRADETPAAAAELDAKGYARIGWAMVTYADGDRGDATNLLRDTAEEHGAEVFQVATIEATPDGWYGFGVLWRKARGGARACEPSDLAGCTERAAAATDPDARLAAYADACAEKHAPACDKLRAYAVSSSKP
ncbi:MAG TPA: hypothetical protein VKE22_07825 [Haliangiales bacterium]|nr:hypothetical protein [Haliangiales bacterium]